MKRKYNVRLLTQESFVEFEVSAENKDDALVEGGMAFQRWKGMLRIEEEFKGIICVDRIY